MNSFRKKIVAVICVTGLFLIKSAALLNAQDINDLTTAYIGNSMKGVSNQAIEKELMNVPAKKLLASFKPFLTDSVMEVRMVAYSIVYRAAYKSEDNALRQEVTMLFIEGLYANNTGLVGRILNYLSDFKPSDYTPEGKYKLSVLAKKEMPYWHKLIQLTGYLQIDELIYNYKQILQNKETIARKVQWAMYLAMARMDDPESVSFVMRTVKSLKINDDVVYDILPDLAYIRQKEAFSYLFEIIQSDKKDCNSSNPSNEAPIICAFRVIAILAPYIDSFPVKVSLSGGLETNNYDEALEISRNWITDNASTYRLILDIY